MVTDYSNPSSWLNVPNEFDKKVDVFYLYPTTWAKKEEDQKVYAEIDHKQMRKGARYVFDAHSLVFSEDCNVFAPFYRQMDAQFAVYEKSEIVEKLSDAITYADIEAAFDYFINNYNDGRPFILAGHSQGSYLLLKLLTGYLKKHQNIYKRMIVAYIVGCAVTNDVLEANPHLKFAKNAYDTGVIVSYNTEAEYLSAESGLIKKDTLCINPINWRTDGKAASYKDNLGEIVRGKDGIVKLISPGTKDALVNSDRGSLMCRTADSSKYKHKWFPKGVYHTYDYEFYFGNLKRNVKDRIESFFSRR